MLKVLITGAWCSLNYGEMAIVLSATENLKRIIKDIQFTIFSSHPSDDFRRYKGYDVRINPPFLVKLHRTSNFRTLDRTLVMFILNLFE
ncbi:MAG: hypothetical protein ACUVXA_19710 [Candidatus Jordarchaeum sp.]|uniref:hypothetical protein n=1 Tax=Candidatus Jordarchaeum sp. TaxID=2823881 RepID=UPI00404B3A5C